MVDKLEVRRAVAETIVETVLWSPVRALQNGEKVELRSFGSLHLRKRGSRVRSVAITIEPELEPRPKAHDQTVDRRAVSPALPKRCKASRSPLLRRGTSGAVA